MNLTIRPAELEDAQALAEWRNDPLTRAMSKNTNSVAWEDHCAWVKRRIAADTPTLFVALDDGVRVGTFRIDDDEISYTIAPERRGMGYAKAMLALAREMFGPLRAEIKAENTASIKAAEAAGHTVFLI